MHRGSSKGARGDRAPEILPLSASPPSGPRIPVTFEFTRAGRSTEQVVEVDGGTPVRAVLRRLGHSPEGCAVLKEGRPIPLDTPLVAPVRLQVVSTFSGG